MKLQKLAVGLVAILLLSACGAKNAEKQEKELAAQVSTASVMDDMAASSIQAEATDVPEDTSELSDAAAEASDETSPDDPNAVGATETANHANKAAEKSGTVQRSAAQRQVGEVSQVQPRGNATSATEVDSAGSLAAGTSEPAHTHDWKPVYSTIHHDEAGHYETVIVQKAYDEPIYEDRCVCKTCGAVFKTSAEIGEHLLWSDTCENYSVEQVQVGTKHHDAVTEQQYVVDNAAFDEKVLNCYQCSCGAIK